MPEFERSETIHADVDRTYKFLADPRNLPKYVATMIMAEPDKDNRVRVAAEVSGRHEEGEARFRSDPRLHRVEWGGTGTSYGGWMEVRSADDGQSTVKIHLTTPRTDESEQIERALAETLRNIAREVG